MILNKGISFKKGLLNQKGLLKGFGLIVGERIPVIPDKFYWKGNYDGLNLVNEVGVNIPYVSGFGLDAVYDFGVLAGNEFDKGSYLGNSFGLPEIYDFPYINGIYYDPTTAATRKHWKLTDFHYKFIENQFYGTLNNIFFLKATATTDTSNIINGVQELAIFSTEQTGSILDKLKKYIGIQPTFRGSEISTDNNLSTWSEFGNIIDKNDVFFQTGTAAAGVTIPVEIGKDYEIFFNYATAVANLSTLALWQGNVVSLISILNQRPSGFFDGDFTAIQSFIFIRLGTAETVYVTNITLKAVYVNYYKS